MSTSVPGSLNFPGSPSESFIDRLNTGWHKVALQAFAVLVLFHWMEHIIQAYQFYVMGWPRAQSMGLLGLKYHWLMKSEILHYAFALAMVVGLWVLRKAFTGTAYKWWMVSFWIQFWHHFEHLILLIQAQTGTFWFGGAVPTSVGQIWIPRIELHLFYNMIVFIPMVVGMYYHVYPPAKELATQVCSCARHSINKAA